MKKKFFYFILLLCFIVLIKFYVADYNISYNIKNVKVVEKATSDYQYFEMTYDDYVFSYMFFEGRSIFKKRVKDIKIKEKGDYVCILPKFKSLDSYYVCSNKTELASYQTFNETDNYVSYSDNFKYFNNLGKDEHIYVWKYDGFYYLNGDSYKSINIFSKDRYSNDLMLKVNEFLIFPKYDGNYLFSDFVVLDMTDGEYEFVESNYKINYDSYYVGNRKSSVFLFDNKDKVLYEINYKKGTIDIVGDVNKGFFKYENGHKKDAKVDEYVKDKISFFDDDNNFYDLEKNYFVNSLNKNIRFKYFNHENISLIGNVENNIYFIYKDKLYRYKNSEANPILHYFEFNFNSKNNVFVYNE